MNYAYHEKDCIIKSSFFKPADFLSEEIREILEYYAIEMCGNDEDKRKVSSDTFEGVIYNERTMDKCGHYFGQRFRAKLSTPTRESEVNFILINSFIYPCLN